MDFQTAGETEKVLGGRQSKSKPAGETALVCSLPSTQRGFCQNQYLPQAQDILQKSLPRLVNILVSTPNQQVEQVLVVQAQNGVNMASGTSTTAPSTATTAPSTAPSMAPLQVAGPSTMEPIVPIGVQLGQDTPSKAYFTNGLLWSGQSVPFWA